MKDMTTKCRNCGGRALLTHWLPTLGLDPATRQFICPACGITTYKILNEKELADAKLQIN